MKKQFLTLSTFLLIVSGTVKAQTMYVPAPGVSPSTTANVGIGTNAPEEKLTVTGGNIKINGTTNALMFGNAIKVYEESNVLKFKTSATDVPRFFIYPSGHIGIGANDWGNALNMYGNIAMGADGNGLLFLGNSNVSSYSNGIGITTNGIRRMNFTAGGNIGIGTDAPTQKLEVNGNAKVSNLFLGNSLFTADQGGALELGAPSNVGINSGGATPYIDFHLGNSLSEDFNVRLINDKANTLHVIGNSEVDGNLIAKGKIAFGIPLNPTSNYRLSVLGGVITDYLTVLLPTNGLFPDYVFHKNYRLMPLSQVEKFIQEEQHLPEVPSAAEIEKNGINTSEMFVIQMKKIEELTLYMIELEKKNKALEEKIEGLVKKKKN